MMDVLMIAIFIRMFWFGEGVLQIFCDWQIKPKEK